MYPALSLGVSKGWLFCWLYVLNSIIWSENIFSFRSDRLFSHMKGFYEKKTQQCTTTAKTGGSSTLWNVPHNTTTFYWPYFINLSFIQRKDKWKYVIEEVIQKLARPGKSSCLSMEQDATAYLFARIRTMRLRRITGGGSIRNFCFLVQTEQKKLVFHVERYYIPYENLKVTLYP